MNRRRSSFLLSAISRLSLASTNGVLTGGYLGGDCTGPEKARRVRTRFDLSKYRVVYAYGDSEEDRPLLRLAHKRYCRWRELEAPT